jgi:hypothetical protein
MQALGHLLLIAAIVEGALLIGWRLTQLPRSQAMEFLLVSPLRPHRLFLAEAAVGLALLGLVTLSGLPLLLLLAAGGTLDPLDIVVLLLMPFTWGSITGLGLTVWAYEPRTIRRCCEVVTVALMLVYLVVGVLAGEKLVFWLDVLPLDWKVGCLRAFVGLHTHNPFGILRFWLENDIPLAWPRTLALELGALVVLALLLWRGSTRLQGHFHERHYQPVRDVSSEARSKVGDRPLSWWAVKRVSEYSGRINLWLAGGFCLLYALYLVAGEHWPVWMGRRVFQMCDSAGGAAALGTGLVLLAAVPAAFQYGLWDSNNQDRCRRLELLLLTDLEPLDYHDAAWRAAWRRGRGYFLAALTVWLAAWLGGRLNTAQLAATIAAGVLLWGLYFALGFRAFVRGAQANGLGMLLTVGLPLGAFALSIGTVARRRLAAAGHGLPGGSWRLHPAVAAGSLPRCRPDAAGRAPIPWRMRRPTAPLVRRSLRQQGHELTERGRSARDADAGLVVARGSPVRRRGGHGSVGRPCTRRAARRTGHTRRRGWWIRRWGGIVLLAPRTAADGCCKNRQRYRNQPPLGSHRLASSIWPLSRLRPGANTPLVILRQVQTEDLPIRTNSPCAITAWHRKASCPAFAELSRR